MALDLDEISKRFDKALEKITPEEIEKYFPPDNTPKRWVNIEEHLPQCYAIDFINKGYSEYKARDKDGNVYLTRVSDHHTWYYMAKDAGITHWLNE